MHIEYRLSLRDVLFFQSYQFDHSPVAVRKRRRSLLAGVAVIIALTGAMAVIASAWQLALVGVAFGGVYLYLYPQLLKSSIRRATMRAYSGKLNVLAPRVLETRPDGLYARADHEESLTPWERVSDTVQLDRYLFILLGSDAAHIVPRDALLSGDFRAFAADVRARAGMRAAPAQ